MINGENRDVRLAQMPTVAMRTLLRQRRVVRLVDPRRNAAMGMPPMPLARLAPRLLWRSRRLVLLAKWCGLPFSCAAQLLHQTSQLLDLLPQPSVLRQQFLITRPPRLRSPFLSRRTHTGTTTKIMLAAHRYAAELPRKR
jgi:hypothetical protein